jgi:hypothetical protein
MPCMQRKFGLLEGEEEDLMDLPEEETPTPDWIAMPRYARL